MEFVIGKKYVCRNGQIAEYVGKTPPEDCKAKWYSEVFLVGDSRHHYMESGRFWSHGHDYPLDIIKEQPMQLEAGKFFKTRDGRKAFVGAVGSPFKNVSTDNQAVGWINGHFGAFGWNADGKHVTSSAPSNVDLVSEWIEPPQEITVDGVVYVRKEK